MFLATNTTESDCSSNDLDSELEHDVTISGHTSGAFFSPSENTWMPISSCCQHPIPEEFPTTASETVRRREACKVVSVDQQSGLPKIDRDGFMIGDDCIPAFDDTCVCDCGRRWADAVFEECGHFIMRTYFGAVLRVKKKAICACGQERLWNPASEFVHTIDNDSEGGEFFISMS